MKITIHRGKNQIGGCITEIATAHNRILIDLGQNLPDNEGVVCDDLANPDAVAKLTKGIDAIFYTHYHGDHVDLYRYVPGSVAQYIGETAKKVMLAKSRRLAKAPRKTGVTQEDIKKLETFKTFQKKDRITIGDIVVIPYFVSHSACDAFMFVIEADGKRVLHTGDFRGHGFLSKKLYAVIDTYVLEFGRKKIDILITEGTMLSRLDERVQHEHDVREKFKEIMQQYKNVFVMCSSTDLERLASVYDAYLKTGNGRPFVCDTYQKDVLEIFSETAGQCSDLFDFSREKEIYDFRKTNHQLIHRIKDKGCCMLIRCTQKFNDWLDDTLLPQLNAEETVFIFSQWQEYINPDSRHAKQDYLALAKKFTHIEKVHTSGHASADCLAEVCNRVNPVEGIIPIHSEHAEEFRNLAISDELKSRIITVIPNQPKPPKNPESPEHTPQPYSPSDS